MKTLTAKEFKDLLSTTHQAVNVKVTEQIIYDITDGSPLTGDILIKNCDLKFLLVSERSLDSFTILNGKIAELRLDTNFQSTIVSLKSDIKALSLVEMNSLTFEFTARTTKTAITGRFAILGDTTWKGTVKSMSLINPDANSVHMQNFEAGTVELISPRIPSVTFNNVKTNKYAITYGADLPEDANFDCKNFDIKDFRITFRGNRLIQLKGPTKNVCWEGWSSIPG